MSRRRVGRAPAWGVAVLLACALVPDVARAAACCTSATVFGVGRLLAWEQAAEGVSLSGSSAAGRWTREGEWRAFDDAFERELRAQAWVLVRAAERVELFARAPWVGNHRGAGDVSSFGHGLGDVQAGARWQVVGIGEYRELPAIAITGSLLAPTGRRAEESPEPFGVGATGRGAWEASFAVEAERTWGPWFARLDGGARASLPFTRTDLGLSQRYGPGLSVGLSGGRAFASDRVTVAAAAQHEREAAYALDGASVTGSNANAWSASLALAWRFLPHWTVQGALSSGLFASGLGTNRPGLVAATVGVRHGHF